MGYYDRHIYVPLPYEMTVNELVLDPASEDDTDLLKILETFAGSVKPPHYTDPNEAMEIMFRSVTCLKARTSQLDLAKCISTAMIWYFG